ncbi:MAG: TIGR02646 family protein [Gemmatimonadota bacterium]|nr:TIGR02646 family protein [Gemmatimonadota bacterium]
MKAIRGLSTPTSGLGQYLEDVGEGANWNEFRSHNSGGSYRELSEALTQNQHGICAYCEITINDLRRQVEHVIPQSDDKDGKKRATDIANMVACCTGGTVQIHAMDRQRRPGRNNISCGQAKGSKNVDDFADPRTLPFLPSVLRVIDDGQIEADESNCKRSGLPSDRLTRTVDILNLNAERLRLQREKQWIGLQEETEKIEDPGNPERINAWIRSLLTPDENDRLNPFFTTTRSYFGALAELILTEEPKNWI